MQAKTIALLLKIAEIIANIFISTRNKTDSKGGDKK
jgi:hypothetical protein